MWSSCEALPQREAQCDEAMDASLRSTRDDDLQWQHCVPFLFNDLERLFLEDTILRDIVASDDHQLACRFRLWPAVFLKTYWSTHDDKLTYNTFDWGVRDQDGRLKGQVAFAVVVPRQSSHLREVAERMRL